MIAIQLECDHTSHRPSLVFNARIPKTTGDTDQTLVRKIFELNENERLDVIATISRRTNNSREEQQNEGDLPIRKIMMRNGAIFRRAGRCGKRIVSDVGQRIAIGGILFENKTKLDGEDEDEGSFTVPPQVT